MNCCACLMSPIASAMNAQLEQPLSVPIAIIPLSQGSLDPSTTIDAFGGRSVANASKGSFVRWLIIFWVHTPMLRCVLP